MKEITHSELLKEYGIDLPKGKYDIVINNDKYEIYEIKDDTSGCILVGENTIPGKLVNSRGWSDIINRMLTEAEERGESNVINICED